MAFYAYFDDSGMPGDSPKVLSMAGYVASDEQWDTFERDWNVLLTRERIRAIHMTDLDNRRGEFKSWSDDRAVRVIREAHDIIQRATIRGVATSLDMHAYKSTIPQAVHEFFGGPHSLCVFLCLVFLREDPGKWKRKKFPFKEPVACFFEKKSGYGHELIALMEQIDEWPAPRTHLAINSFDFVDKIQRPELQAADVLTYESNKHWYNQFFSKTQKGKMRRSLGNLYRDRDFGYYYDSLGLQRFVSDSMDAIPP